ncbi:MAG: TonB family protein [Thermoanaerobaculales bacterium]|nr:TonB family protein [Thermoanaerobaculales bacterium]
MTQRYRSFGSYILFKEIHSDEIGHLYKAGEFDASGIKRTTWLRVFDGDGVPADDITQALDTARQIGGVLQAANVASGGTFFAEDGVPAMAYDHLAGQPLARLFEKVHEEGFPVPVDNALLIMEKIALGLASALTVDVGGLSLAHGFLHPGLILVTNDGEGVVSGFGVADALLGLLDVPTIADQVKPFLAPEVIFNRSATKRGDVYSLGAMLYQLVTGSPLPADPEAREGILDSAELLYEDEPLPDDIKALISRCIASRAEDRFSSAADFKKDLDKLLYGGNYSPTTFNLALFMDRLFRTDIEADEKDSAAESAVSVEPYLKSEPEPEMVEEVPVVAPSGGGKNLYYAIAAVLVLIAVGVIFIMMRGPSTPATPELTPEQVAAQRAAQEETIRELAARLVEEKMQEQEAQIRIELEASQKRIEDLQKQLQKSTKSTSSAADRKKQEDLQRRLEAEKEDRRRRQAAAEEEKRKLVEQARIEAEETARREAEAQAVAAAVKVQPTAAPPATPTIAVATTTGPEAPLATITENQFVDPTEVDTLPAIIKEAPVDWPRSAKKSRRQGMIILRATVDARGRVEAVEILRADETGFGIPEAVMDSVRGYLFKPGTKNGVKIKTHATVTKRYVFR